jgi:hypothetical protein
MATLAALLADVLPTATVAPGAASSLDRDVGWVRLVRARVPALDVLDPGDLVLVPERALAVIAPGRDQVDGLVAALVDGGAAGAVIITAEGEAVVAAADAASGEDAARPAGPAADLVAGLVRAGLPVAEVAGADPVAIERTVIAWLVNRRAALEARAEELERRLEAVALADGDPTALVAAIGGFLGRAVALEGRRGHPLALHAPARPPAAADAARRYLASRSGVALRVALPAPAVAGAVDADPAALPAPPRGSLLLLGDEPPTEGERLACERVAALLALELGREVAVARAREEARRGGTLPADGPPWVVLVARQADDLPAAGPAADPAARPGPHGGARAMATAAMLPTPSSTERREALRAELRLLAPPRRLALRGSAESLEYRLVAVADAADPGGLVTADRVARLIRRLVAVSRPFRDPADRPQAEAEARATLEAAEATVEGARVVRADRLPAYRILGGLHDMPDGQRLSRALLAPVLAGRPATVAGRLETLRAVLDAAGPIEAAQALGVHRNTVAYRIRRLEELGGWDLADADLRLALSTALRIVQNAQE